MKTFQVTCTVSFGVSADVEADTAKEAVQKAYGMAKFSPSLCHQCARGHGDLESGDFIACDEDGNVLYSQVDDE